MKVINNTIYADDGKVLKYLDSFATTYSNVDINDIEEYYQIILLGKVYFLPCKSYSELITDLIRLKYSLDQELALYANLNSDPEKYKSEYKDFQDWRILCKNTAKRLFNE